MSRENLILHGKKVKVSPILRENLARSRWATGGVDG
jgi:hypothetical protein